MTHLLQKRLPSLCAVIRSCTFSPCTAIKNVPLIYQPTAPLSLMNKLKKILTCFSASACFKATDGFVSGGLSDSLTPGVVAYSMFYVFALDKVAW